MKKTLSIASLLAMILSVAIFTSCSEPEATILLLGQKKKVMKRKLI